jgi:hypothetical protein
MACDTPSSIIARRQHELKASFGLPYFYFTLSLSTYFNILDNDIMSKPRFKLLGSASSFPNTQTRRDKFYLLICARKVLKD